MTKVVQARPVVDSPADLDILVIELHGLRMRIRELETRAKPLRDAVISGLKRAGCASFTTSAGTTARLGTQGPETTLEIE